MVNLAEAWRRSPDAPPRNARFSSSWQLDRCVTHQNKIGWRNFLFGRISPLWKVYQRSYLLEIKSRRTPEAWAHQLISHIWKIVFVLWDTRNDTKHNDDTTARIEANNQINEQLEQQYLLGTSTLSSIDVSLLDLPLEDVLTSPFDYKTRLLGSLEAARANFAHHQQQQYASWHQLRERMRAWLASNSDHSA